MLAIVGLVDIIIFFQASEEEAAFLKGLKALRSIRLLRSLAKPKAGDTVGGSFQLSPFVCSLFDLLYG